MCCVEELGRKGWKSRDGGERVGVSSGGKRMAERINKR